MHQPTDFLLLQTRPPQPDAAQLHTELSAWCATRPAGLELHLQRLACGLNDPVVYAYLQLPHTTPLGAETPQTLERTLGERWPWAGGWQVSRLQLALERQGASHAQTPHFHYVVEMDPEAGWADEIFRWYDTEHMPGLAAVPGTVQARRLLNHDHGPLSLACYDLVTEQTLGSAPWLAVRGTAWSDIARPHFTNTRRTMMGITLAPGTY